MIADTIGQENADRLTDCVGGLRLAIPLYLENGRAPDRLAKRVGNDLGVLLILHFGGGLVYVPVREPSGPVSLRSVVRLTKQNMSADDIAKRLRCSVRTVYSKRAEARTAGLLPPLINAG